MNLSLARNSLPCGLGELYQQCGCSSIYCQDWGNQWCTGRLGESMVYRESGEINGVRESGEINGA